MTYESIRALDELVQAGIMETAFPGACYAVGTRERVWVGSRGRYTYCPESPTVRADTIWDLASVTKVVACTTSAMVLRDEGLLELDRPVAMVVPEFAANGKEWVTPRDLLLHRSGMRAGKALHTQVRTPEEAMQVALRVDLLNPRGTTTLYSDLSMIALGEMIGRIARRPLDQFSLERVFVPLGMRATFYNPTPRFHVRCAPTETVEPWRLAFRRLQGKPKPQGSRLGDEDFWIQGEVHDPSAMALGGVSGNAGLFSTAPDLARFCQMMLGEGELGGRRVVEASTVREWTTRYDDKSTRALGWDTRAETGSSAGTRFSRRSFGHTGYTGTSVWIDPEAGLFGVLLTNRVHPSAENLKITGFRRRFYDATYLALSGGRGAD